MQHPAAVPAGFAVATALVAALAGWGLVEALERRTAHPRRTWLITAPVVLLVSLGGPLSGHGVSAGDRLALVRLRLTVAAVLIAALGRTLATHRRTRPAEPSPPQRHQPERQPDDHHDRSHLSHELACRVSDGVTLVRRLPGGRYRRRRRLPCE